MHRKAFVLFAFLLGIGFAQGAEVGAVAPGIELPSLVDGTVMRLSDFRGKIVYVDFWASWCGPCRMSLPALEKIRNAHRDDFEVLAINLDEDPEDGLAFLERFPVSYPVLSDPAAIYPPLFGVKGMPTSYIVDRDGVLRYVHEGYREGDAELIRRMVRRLIADER